MSDSGISVNLNDMILDADFGEVTIISGGSKVHYGSTSYWNSQAELVGKAGEIYIYSDYTTDSLGQNVAGLKVGDGTALLINVPFIDAELRQLIAALGSPAHFIGETTTELTNHATTNPIIINEQEVTAVSGDIVVYLSQEFIFDGTWWVRLGDFVGLGELAYKNSVSVVTTATGTCTGGNVTLATQLIGSMTNAGTLPSIVDSIPSDTSKPQPVKFSISGTKLSITMGTFNAGTLPTREEATVATGIDTITQPTFTGNAVSGEVTYG